MSSKPDKKGLTTIVYKGLMKSHSKYRDKLTRELEEEIEPVIGGIPTNCSVLSQQILCDDE